MNNSAESDRDPLELEFECYAAILSIEETFKELESIMAADLATTIRTVSSGIDALKKLTDLAIKSRNVELQEGILKLREELIDVRDGLMTAREENFELREENKQLKERVAELEKGAEEKLVFRDGFYYKQDGDGPFCPGCYDNKGKELRLVPMPLSVPGLRCPTCKNVFGLGGR